MRWPEVFAVLVAAALWVSGCASVGSGAPDQLRGSSGPVSWEVVNLRQRSAPDGKEIRWYYTLVLKETAGRAINFEKEERGAEGLRVRGSNQEWTFQQRLAASSELRLNYRDGIYITDTPGFGQAPGGQYGMAVFRRYHGKDDAGNPVTITVRITLSPSSGKNVRQAATSGPLPPLRNLRPGELNGLAGKWQGYTRDEKGFEIPLELTIREDGSFDAAEDEPVINRFRGTLSVRDGQILYSQRNDTGTLTLHEGGGRRVLVGSFGGIREGRSDQPGASSYTVRYSLRLERIE